MNTVSKANNVKILNRVYITEKVINSDGSVSEAEGWGYKDKVTKELIILKSTLRAWRRC